MAAKRTDAKLVQVPTRKRAAAKKCPVCGRPPEADTVPFCSKRCADADLARWLGEGYRIPTNETPEDDPAPDDD